eukprot:TRINITY_DN29409_c0_g1_i2.p1 TRINITY_DN29409_c0_g1~~TRINITY_DN29409_c0_g1_i2.p1  ORF type:complete len:589 (+),score=94.46 TRINITY_DN29409_c0_g1_i2:119-1885(+)
MQRARSPPGGSIVQRLVGAFSRCQGRGAACGAPWLMADFQELHPQQRYVELSAWPEPFRMPAQRRRPRVSCRFLAPQSHCVGRQREPWRRYGGLASSVASFASGRRGARLGLEQAGGQGSHSSLRGLFGATRRAACGIAPRWQPLSVVGAPCRGVRGSFTAPSRSRPQLQHGRANDIVILDVLVDDPGLTPLAEQLHGPRSLRFLRLSGNELIGTEVGDGHGVAVLFAALPRAKSLQVLELDSTGVDDAGLEALQLYLTDGGSLKELHLERTQITDAGLHALMVAGGCALEKLYMGEGAVSQESLAALAELVATGGEAARPQTASRRGAVDEAARPMTGSRRGAAHEAEAGRPLTGSRRGAADAAGRPATGSRRSAADEAARPLTGSRRGTADDAADRPLTGSRRSAVDEAARPLTGVRRSAADEADRPLTSSWRNTADEVNLQPRAVSSVAVAAGAFATLPAPEVQNYLRRWFHGSVPVHVKFANQRLADELVYIGSLEEACVAEVDVEPSKKQPVRLLTDDEKAYLTEALMDKMREVEIRYELDSEIRSTPAWQDHVRALYFPKIEQLKKDVARLSSDYIFVAREG